ncbi:Spore coat protein CotO [Thalassobacillus cyri]|uniref:Spore coat protein CotO n=1 Tax=Thalassobacillus cyri TaxID=571932 RepID=A0A1H3VLR9_9BACI|nr:CotO family spore coat protein [Thalassobacillus cyri]SDZ75726.1 Spore coat protein CotO [Thalassobacillus cyri]
MGKQSKLEQRPMLYIAQPDFAPSKASMQTTYHGKKTAKEQEKGKSAPEPEGKQSRELEDNPARKKQRVEHHQPEAEQETKSQSRAGSARDRRQRFRDMTLEEKVTYFVNLPSQIPKMKCEVETEEGKLRGYINDYQGGIVHMKTFQRPFQKEIKFAEIIDINLIGF